MKILVCVYEYYPKGSGIANVAYYVVENLKKRGHNCTVISSNSGDIPLDYDKKIKRYAGIGLLLFWKKVRQYINKNYDNYDLIWIHNPLFLGKINPNKVYATVHTSYVKYWDLYRNNKDYSKALKAYYFFIKKVEQMCYRKNKFKSNVISPAVVDELVRLGIKKKDITYIPNGVDTKLFCPAEKSKNEENKETKSTKQKSKIKKLICVGRVSYQKNPYGLIRAIQELNKDKQKVDFSWIGDGELLEALRKYVIDNKIKGAKFVGKIHHDKLHSIYQKGDVYILASIYEGQPLTMLEAMSTGLPCIVSDIENMAHIIRESKCGKVVNFDDPKKAAKEIEKYISSDKLAKDKIKVREYSVKNLDWSKITDRYEEEWNKLLKK